MELGRKKIGHPSSQETDHKKLSSIKLLIATNCNTNKGEG